MLPHLLLPEVMKVTALEVMEVMAMEALEVTAIEIMEVGIASMERTPWALWPQCSDYSPTW